MLKTIEANKTDEKKHSYLQDEGREFSQDPSEETGYKEEEVLRFMEEQDISSHSGKKYQFILAERNDTIKFTGRYKYLPVNICGYEGEK